MNVVADRFEIDRVAGQGGMGTVFRARDRRTDRVVALKIVEPEFATSRFKREAELLSELSDPAIVRYVDHGPLDGGRMYLAMEWLEGVSLEERVAATPLGIDDSLAVGRRIASALESAHAKGVVHRDVKPANVILRDGRAADATLVDFGIARAKDKRQTMTATGVIIGTPAYMAPEQARGQAVDARADVFALGCVLFECLCGRPAFVGEHVVAVLAKILLESPPRVRALRADVPPALDALVAKMLEKDAAARPESGGDARRLLEAIAAGSPPSMLANAMPVALGASESRLATVLLARISDDSDASFGSDSALANLTAESAFTDAGERFDVPLTTLANGTLVGVVVASEGANDSAARAARCALAMRSSAPNATVVLATGRAVVSADLPVGTAIDEAARLLTFRDRTRGVFVDEGTADLLDRRFEMAREERGIRLVREREGVNTLPPVVPCIGRERELSLLEATFDECVDEPIAQAMLLVAPPGLGKSRVRRELVMRLEARDDAPQVWLGLADPVMAQAPFALAGDVLRRAFAIAEDEPLDTRRAKVLARTGSERTARLLGEIAGAPFDDADDPILRAARNKPGLLAAQLDDALLDFVEKELEKGPLVIALEDVHWADASSLRLFRHLLERKADRPIFVLALARPNVDEAHPQLWTDVRRQRITLQPLLKKAASALARAMLGQAANVDAIVERAEGNALFVEELARARLDGDSRADLPLTVAAAAEARIAAIEPEARLVLRAGAVFGERFWRGAVAKLVGAEAAASIDERLAMLERLEVVTRSGESRFKGEPELVFRHALVRDAAYAMLTEHDRKLAHALAGEWLEARIDDAVLLAHHFEEGDRAPDAARWHVQAAEDALAANAFDAVGVHTSRARALGIEGELAGRAHLAVARVALWRGANPDAREEAIAATNALVRGSAPWFTAVGIAGVATGKLERHDDLLVLARALEDTPAGSPESGRERAISRARIAIQLYYLGEPEVADRLATGCEDEPGAAGDAHVGLWLVDLRYERGLAMGTPLRPEELLEARSLAESIGDLRGVIMLEGNYCVSLLGVGAYDEAVRAAESMLAHAPAGATDYLVFVNTLIRAVAAAMAGDTRAYEETSAALLTRNVRVGIANRIWLALLLHFGRHYDRSREVLEQVFDQTEGARPFRSIAVAIALRLALRQGDRERAAELLAELDASIHRGVAVWGRPFCDAARVEGHEAFGNMEAARAALDLGVAHLRRCADAVGDWRDVFLHRRHDSAELVAMAKERGIIVA